MRKQARKPRVLVCGGRDFKSEENYRRMAEFLDNLALERGWTLPPDEYGNWLPDFVLIHGGAKGADTLADEYGAVNWLDIEVYPAQWDKNGRAAGPIRNKEMLEKGKPDLVVAFPGGRGTTHMVSIAHKANIEVIYVD